LEELAVTAKMQKSGSKTTVSSAMKSLDINDVESNKKEHHVFEPRPYFGVSLSSIVEREGSEVPNMVVKCTDFLEKTALDEEGILRLSGSTVEIQEIRDKIEQGNFDFTGRDPHAVAGILKSFFRELPESIISQEINNGIAAVLTYGEGQEVIDEIKNIFDSLPKPNFNLLKHLTSFLVKISSHSDKNKMNTNNLLRVMTPTLNVIPGIISLAMVNFDYIFAVPAVVVSETPVVGSSENKDGPKEEIKSDSEESSKKKKKHHKHKKDKDKESSGTREKKHKKEKKSKKEGSLAESEGSESTKKEESANKEETQEREKVEKGGKFS